MEFENIREDSFDCLAMCFMMLAYNPHLWPMVSTNSGWNYHRCVTTIFMGRFIWYLKLNGYAKIISWQHINFDVLMGNHV